MPFNLFTCPEGISTSMLLILILLPAIAMVVIWVYCRVGQEVLLTALASSRLNRSIGEMLMVLGHCSEKEVTVAVHHNDGGYQR